MACFRYACLIVLAGIALKLTSSEELQDDIIDDEFVKRMFSLIRYHKGFLDRFDPLDLTDLLSNNTNHSCFKTLHGLSRMRLSSPVMYSWGNMSLKAVVDFEYPKLCMKCDPSIFENLGSDELEQAISIEIGRLINVCAEYVEGQIEIEIPLQDNQSAATCHFFMKEANFSMDVLGNRKLVGLPNVARKVWKQVEQFLPSPGTIVHSIFDQRNLSNELWSYMVLAYNEAGECSMGNCTVLEDMTDSELKNVLYINLRRVIRTSQSLDPWIINRSVVFESDEYEIHNDSLWGLSSVKISAFNKIQRTGERWYKMDVILRFPSICISAEIRNRTDPAQATNLIRCALNVRTLVRFDILGDTTEPMKIESVDIISPSFCWPFDNKKYEGVLKDTLKEYLQSVSRQTGNIITRLIEDTVSTMFRTSMQDLIGFDFGNCFVELSPSTVLSTHLPTLEPTSVIAPYDIFFLYVRPNTVCPLP